MKPDLYTNNREQSSLFTFLFSFWGCTGTKEKAKRNENRGDLKEKEVSWKKIKEMKEI